jgi:acyl-CoA thioester hydrolase
MGRRRDGAIHFGDAAELATPTRATSPPGVLAIGRLTTAGVPHSVACHAMDRRRRAGAAVTEPKDRTYKGVSRLRRRPKSLAPFPVAPVQDQQSRGDMAPESLVTYRGTVYPWHCDHVGHMNVMWYVGKFDEATWQFFNALGLTPQYLRTAKRGMAAVDQHISYIRELYAGDVVSVRTTLVGFKEKSVQFIHEMTNDESNDVVAKTTLKAVHLDTEQRKSCAFSEAIAAKMASLLAGDAPR